MRAFNARYEHHAHGFDWAVAAILITVFQLLTWQLMALGGRPVPLLPMTWQILTSVAAYPLVVAFCAWVQRRAFGMDDMQ